jgi:hypothetical protein
VAVYLLGRAGVAAVEDPHAVPVEPADAAAAVAPGDPRAERQLALGVNIGADRPDRRVHLLQACVEVAHSGVLGVVQP